MLVDVVIFQPQEQDDEVDFQSLRKEYKNQHGHYPEDYKSRMDCIMCSEESSRQFNAIEGESI